MLLNNMKTILLILFVILSNPLDAMSRIVGIPFDSVQVWRHWEVTDGIAKDQISFYNYESNPIKIKVNLIHMGYHSTYEDSTLFTVIPKQTIGVNKLVTYNLPPIDIPNSPRLYYHIIKESCKDTTEGYLQYFSYFPTEYDLGNGDYISFGSNNNDNVICKIDSIVLKNNISSRVELYIDISESVENEEKFRKIIFVKKVKVRDYFLTKGDTLGYSRFMKKIQIDYEVLSSDSMEYSEEEFGFSYKTSEIKEQNYKKIVIKIKPVKTNGCAIQILDMREAVFWGSGLISVPFLICSG